MSTRFPSRISSLAYAAVLPVAALMLVLGADPAEATPAFARKYGTSCQTCHIAYPKLNTFGQAFRTLGYRFPGETEAQIKQPDTRLGAPGQKKAFPGVVWPGAIPSQVPLSVVASAGVVNSSALEDGEQERNKYDFVMPGEVALIAAGTAGDNVAYFGEVAVRQEPEDGTLRTEIELDHFDVRLVRPIKDSLAFNFKIGSFQPEFVNTFDHARRLTIANYDSMFSVQPVAPGGATAVGGAHGGGAGVAVPAVTRGFEFYGVVSHRLQWSAGVVNGAEAGLESFDSNSLKDVYGQVSWKFGGLAPDGSNADTYSTSDKNWREKSVRLGLFVYRGDGRDTFYPTAGEEDGHGSGGEEEGEEDEGVAFVENGEFTRVGVDFNIFYKDLNLFGAWVRGRDDIRAFGESHDQPGLPGELDPHESGTYTYNSFMVEADVVLGYPWLHGAARYERVDLPAERATNWERGVVSLTGLYRANVKATVEYAWDLNESKNYAGWFSMGIGF